MYGDGEIGKVKCVRGKRHPYLGMVLDYTEPGKFKLDMTDYVKSMIKDFPQDLKPANYPWNDNLFKVDENSPKLGKKDAATFVTFAYKGLFVSKRGRQDVAPAIAFLLTRVNAPTEQDWKKLLLLMRFLKKTQDDMPTYEMKGKMISIKWHLDAAFAVHADMRSHTGASLTFGKGSLQLVSTKQKINTRSSTEAELVSNDDVIAKGLWTRRFLEAQGYTVHENLIYRDNQSSIKLEVNGRASAGKRTRHFDIKYFFITDLINRNEVQIEYCPTDLMISDYMTKPLLGKKFHEFRKMIMNLPDKSVDSRAQECVGPQT